MAVARERLVQALEKTGVKETGIPIPSIFTSRRYHRAEEEAKSGFGVSNWSGAYYDHLRRLVDGSYVLDRGDGYLSTTQEIQKETDSAFINGKIRTTILIARTMQSGNTFKVVQRYTELLPDGKRGAVVREEAMAYFIGEEARLRAMELSAEYIRGR